MVWSDANEAMCGVMSKHGAAQLSAVQRRRFAHATQAHDADGKVAGRRPRQPGDALGAVCARASQIFTGLVS